MQKITTEKGLAKLLIEKLGKKNKVELCTQTEAAENNVLIPPEKWMESTVIQEGTLDYMKMIPLTYSQSPPQ